MNTCEGCPFREAVERELFEVAADIIEHQTLAEAATEQEKFNALMGSIELDKARGSLNECQGGVADDTNPEQVRCGSSYIRSIMNPMLKTILNVEPSEGWAAEL